jgi:FkbM family methyltransferase
MLVNGRRFCFYPDCVISSALIYADYPEFAEFALLKRVLKPTDVVIDIGANVGHFGMLLSDIVESRNIVAFEPTPLTFARLKENWDLNAELESPKLLQMAVGDFEGTVRFPDVSDPNTMNAIINDATASLQPDIPTIEVAITRLDAQRELWAGKQIGLLKIDVEGHEPAVFRGAQMTLAEDRPLLIMFESLSGKLDPAIAETLAATNYVVFQLDSHGRVDFEHCDAQNVFACPAECRDRILNCSQL